ncbi:unnamed protein product [Symbiodinium sp. CCMP2456]|nr:unnamed protein product [Symbiodinium sp. CCMP2456]
MLRSSSTCLHCKSKPIRRRAAGQGSDNPFALSMNRNKRYHMAGLQVQRLEQENAALRELVRRFHIKLKEDHPCNPSKVQPGKDPCAGRLHQKAVSLPSVWSSPEPLAAAMLRPSRRRPSLVPALNLSDIWDSSEYEEEEEEEADDNDDSEVLDGDAGMAVLAA